MTSLDSIIAQCLQTSLSRDLRWLTRVFLRLDSAATIACHTSALIERAKMTRYRTTLGGRLVYLAVVYVIAEIWF